MQHTATLDQRERAVYAELRADIVRAIYTDPRKLLRTPKGQNALTPCVSVVAEYLGVGDELGLIDHALGVVAMAAESKDPRLSQVANAWLGRIAHAYADSNLADVLDQLDQLDQGAARAVA